MVVELGRWAIVQQGIYRGRRGVVAGMRTLPDGSVQCHLINPHTHDDFGFKYIEYLARCEPEPFESQLPDDVRRSLLNILRGRDHG